MAFRLALWAARGACVRHRPVADPILLGHWFLHRKYCREPIVSRALRPPDSAMNCCPGNRGSGGAQIRNHVSFGRSADGAMPWDEPGHGRSPGPVKDFGEGDIASGKLPPAGGVMVRL